MGLTPHKGRVGTAGLASEASDGGDKRWRNGNGMATYRMTPSRLLRD